MSNEIPSSPLESSTFPSEAHHAAPPVRGAAAPNSMGNRIIRGLDKTTDFLRGSVKALTVELPTTVKEVTGDLRESGGRMLTGAREAIAGRYETAKTALSSTISGAREKISSNYASAKDRVFPSHEVKLQRATERAGSKSTIDTEHLKTARQHVADTLNHMNSKPANHKQAVAFKNLKPKHIENVVQQYAGKLAEGKTFGPEDPHLTRSLIKETGPTGKEARVVVNKVSDAGMHVVNTAGSAMKTGSSVALDATKTFAKGSVAVGKFAGKALLVGGIAATGLYMLSGLLRGSNPPRRLESVNDSFGDMPVVFNPGAQVNVGAMAVPQVGQQAQMGSFAQQVQSGAQDMGAQVPTR